MNGMNDQRFHDLAMKVLARQATEAERAELDSLLTGHPQLKEEFERLRVDVRIGTELLPVVAATEATAPEFPAYARERLQTKVRQTLGANPASAKEAESARGWAWRLWLGLGRLASQNLHGQIEEPLVIHSIHRRNASSSFFNLGCRAPSLRIASSPRLR